ncbi:MAG: ankyrin repeat domain-containing protein [Dysgonomonas sp.]|nr:ankyrin repeat domain-containing protein [Dysgonomonas sp.]
MRVCLLILFYVVQFSISAQNNNVVNKDEQELLNAVRNFDCETVQGKLKSGVNPNIKGEDGQTPLMVAASKKDIEMAKLLIESGAEINIVNEKISLPLLLRLSPLDYAVHTDDTAIVNYLIDAGAYLNPPKDSDCGNPAIVASERLNIKMAKYLLDKGCKVSLNQRKDFVISHIILNDQLKKLTGNNRNELIIRFWINYGSPLLVKDLFEHSIFKENKQKVLDYMQVYYQSHIKAREEYGLERALAKGFSPTRQDDVREEKRVLAYKEKEEKRKKQKQEAWEKELERQEKSKSEQRKILFFILLVVGVFVYILIKRSQNNTSFQNSNLRSNNNQGSPSPAPPKPSPAANKQRQTKPKKETRKTPAKKTKKKEPLISDKGWSEDNTLNIEVTFLTIEDMIYPLRLRNEHEKIVKKMIQYIRVLSRYTDEQIEQTLGEKGLIVHLDNLWDKINPDFVRDVYKRSLFLIVEDYSKRDERVKVFLSQKLKKKRTRKKKSDEVSE